jgi:hypothetical protein
MAKAVQLVKAQVLGLRRCVHFHWNIHQAKGKRTIPHAPHLLTPSFLLSLGDLEGKYPCKS